jgi:soluble cytochrome b562
MATALTQKDEELAAYKAAHEKCVEDAVDESVRIHDEIEARRDGLEALVAQKDETIQQLQAEQGTVIEACAAYLDRNYGDEGAEFVAALRQQAWGPILPTPLQEPR